MGRDVKVGHRPAPPCLVSHRGPWAKDGSIQCIDDQTQVRPALDREGAVSSGNQEVWPRRLDGAGREGELCWLVLCQDSVAGWGAGGTLIDLPRVMAAVSLPSSNQLPLWPTPAMVRTGKGSPRLTKSTQ